MRLKKIKLKRLKLNPKLFFKKHDVTYFPAVKYLFKIKSVDIPITYAARLKCHNCGAFKRKITCPPFAPSIPKCKKIIHEKYNRALVFIARSDGTIPWREMTDKEEVDMLAKKYGRGLKGVSMGLQVSMHNLMLGLRQKLHRGLYLIPGPCHKCRECNVGGACRKGASLNCPEGLGIDVYSLLEKLGVRYETMPNKDVVAVSMILYRKGEK